MQVQNAMSALGQKQTFALHQPMSALPPKADMCGARGYVRFGPGADSCGATKRSLFDHLVGDGKERRRYGEPEHAGGFGVDDEFELRRLHHGQVRRLRALEDATYIAADLAIGVGDTGPIAN